MKFKEVVGLDISKLTIDVAIHTSKSHFVIKNKPRGFKALINRVFKLCDCDCEKIVFVLEHTGMYSHQISLFFSQNNIPFVIVPGLEIKRSLGISRGKNDKIDAQKIARYAYIRRDELQLHKVPQENLLSLKRLLGLRDKMVKQRAGYKVSLKEAKSVYKRKENEVLFKTQEQLIHHLSKQIKAVETQMMNIINNDLKLLQMFKLITSIKGIGQQTALYMIVYTNAFTKFKNARKFASYCGVAPFPNQSGSSLKGKTKISNLAFKKLKSLLDLCAWSAIQFDPELKFYYHRRVNEGKNKRCTLNVIRFKLITRMFAVINRKTPFVDTFKFAA